MRKKVEVLVAVFFFPAFLSGATFTVVNTNDSGPGSLRQAILSANVTPGADTINFSIGSGPQTIAPLSPLPTITDLVAIDGSTQPGFAGTPVIELSGASAGFGANGLHITAGGTTVQSLVINRFQPVFLGGGGNGIVLEAGGGNMISGCFIGTDISGNAALGNGANGVLISRSANNQIFTQAFPTRLNLFSGNGTGIRIEGVGADGNRIESNYIGTDQTGTRDLGNLGDGIVILAGNGNRIDTLGGLPPAPSQLISGNNRSGVLIAGSATGTVVTRNVIGTDINQLADLGNSFNGVEVSGASDNEISGNIISGNDLNGVSLLSGATRNRVISNVIGLNGSGTSRLGNTANGVIASAANGNTIGGATAAARNIISGNGTHGVRLRSGATGNVVQGNFIGTNAAGTAALGNVEEGIEINDGSSNNTIGGMPSGAGNLIAFNSGDGTFIESGAANAILSNSIFSNAGLGIDLAPDGVTPNDPGDGDTGPNNLQNFPVLTQASSPGGTTSVQGSLNSTANTSFSLQFFSSPVCDPSGHGEGQTFLGSTPVTTDGTGNASFAASLPATAGSFVTATATDPAGNSSEFAACIPLSAAFYTVSPCRVVDTRGPNGPYGGPPLAGNSSRSFVLAGQCTIPSTAKAVALNVTATGPSAPGHLTVYSGGTPAPSTSTINYRVGQTRANNAIVTLGPAGGLTVACAQATGAVHLILDVTGYFE